MFSFFIYFFVFSMCCAKLSGLFCNYSIFICIGYTGRANGYYTFAKENPCVKKLSQFSPKLLL